MEETDKSQANVTLHVSLTKWSTVKSAIPIINETYELTLDPADYEDKLAFRNEAGFLSLELVVISTGKLDWVIVDRESLLDTSLVSGVLSNPKEISFKQVIRNSGILINTEVELKFLEDCRLDVRYDASVVGKDKAVKLMNLLNDYGVGDGWTANPSQGCTTAYFVPRYYGSGKDAPDVYNFNRNASCLVVLELMMYGVYELHALVVR